jgi:hypothetical protein
MFFIDRCGKDASAFGAKLFHILTNGTFLADFNNSLVFYFRYLVVVGEASRAESGCVSSPLRCR